MNLRLKKLHPKAILPVYAHADDSCIDLFTTGIKSVTREYIEYGIGWAMEIPAGFIGFSNQRSSISKKNLIWNTSGDIDPGYRGEVTCRFYCKQDHEAIYLIWKAAQDNAAKKLDNFATPEETELLLASSYNIYRAGEAIAQFKLLPRIQIDTEVVDQLSVTERGEGGHGSSDKH